MALEVRRDARRNYYDPKTGDSYYAVSQVLAVITGTEGWWCGSERLEQARQFGNTVHRLAATLMASMDGLCDAPEIGPDEGLPLHNAYRALCAFVHDHHVRPISVEMQVVHERLGYAGTLDLLTRLRLDNNIWVVDFKTGIKHSMHPIQTLAYGKALKQNVKTMSVYLDKNTGTYSVEENRGSMAQEWNWFICGLNLLRARETF